MFVVSRPEVDINAQRKAEVINIHQGPQKMLKHRKLMVECYYYTLQIHFLSIYMPISIIIPLFSSSFMPLYRDDIVGCINLWN